jgi:hypothetical protein
LADTLVPERHGAAAGSGTAPAPPHGRQSKPPRGKRAGRRCRRANGVARRIELMHKARPKEPAVLVVGGRSCDRPGATRAVIFLMRRPLSRVIFASSNAGVLLAHRGESCRPGVVSIEPDIGDVVRCLKASGSEAEGLEARLR